MKSMRNLFIILGIAALIMLVLAVWEKERNSRPFKPLKFKSKVKIHNRTNYDRIDTIFMALSEKIYDLDSAHIYLLPLKDKAPNFRFYGITQQLHFDPYVYYIYVAPDLSLSKLKIVLSHEFVHVDQFKRGDLVYRAPNYFWKGEKVESTEPYNLRPFEKEAFMRDSEILKELNKALY
jgi:hypothetical protein